MWFQINSRYAANRGVFAAFVMIAAAGILGPGCGASFSPPARAEVGFSASRALDGDYELEATSVKLGVDDDSATGDFAYQATFRGPIAKSTAWELSWFGRGAPTEEYGWGMFSGALRKRLGDASDRLALVTGLTAGGGVGGRWPGYEEGSERMPRALSAGLDVGVRVRADEWLDGLCFVLEHRWSRSYSGAGRENHQPPTTDWTQLSAAARLQRGGLFGTAGVSAASWTNYHSDGGVGPMLVVAIGYSFRDEGQATNLR